MKILAPILLLLLSSEINSPPGPTIILEHFASGLIAPVDISNAGDARLFIVERGGAIQVLDANGNAHSEAFLDINSQIASGGERGLLGLVFHPDYANNGYFFVNYTNLSGATQVSRFSVSAGDPNQADPNSEKFILTVAQPFPNHNAGDLSFGPDGYLYIGMGDGGSAGDPGNRGQANVLLGKMLRIDIDTNAATAYAIPGDNPFVGNSSFRDEIWAIGLRNPWRHSFDHQTGDLWIADVGQGAWEEIDFQPSASSGGENYGWRCYEANAVFNPNNCGPRSNYDFPLHAYAHTGGRCSITGGFVYRGSSYSDFIGRYFYADFCTGEIFSLMPDGSGGWINQLSLNWNDFQITSFGEDANQELYLSALDQGRIYKLTTN